MIVGEAPGEQETNLGRPFVGASGYELDRLLSDAGIMRGECFVTNVARVRPPGNEIERNAKCSTGFVDRRKTQPEEGWQWHQDLWYSPEISEGLTLLRQEVESCQPDVIVAFGNVALWALTGNWSIGKWRGSLVTVKTPTGSYTVVPTYHPAYVLRDWSSRSFVVSDLKRAAKVLREGQPVWADYNFIIHPQFEKAESVLRDLIDRAANGPFALAADIESRYWESGNGQIDCIGFAWSKVDAICIPWMRYGQPNHWSEAEEFVLVKLVRQLVSHPNVLVIWQNGAYDAQYLWRYWRVRPNIAFDTMLAQHVCWPGTPKALDVLSSLHCENHLFWKDDNKQANTKQDDSERWRYNCLDVVRTWEVAESEVTMVEALHMVEPLIDLHRTWHRTFDTMRDGIRMDVAQKAAWSSLLEEEERSRLHWIEDVVGHPLNPKSPKKMQEFFYGDLKIRPVISRKTGNPTCDDEALDKIALREPLVRPIVRRISEIRSLGVFRSTFVDATLDHDGRMRTAYNVAGPETFRLNSATNAFGSGANLQNIPVGGEDADSDLVLPNIRTLYIPDEGREMFDTDLSSADPRIVAAESGCKWLNECFAAGLNPYVEIAKEYYRDKTITKAHPRYRTFKELVNGTHYLGTASGLAQRIGLLTAEVERAQAWYFGACPEIKSWHERLESSLARTHTVTNRFGYRRFYFDRIQGTVKNQAVAWIPQSTVAILINKIWDHILSTAPAHLNLQVLLQVHDSLTGQYLIEHAEEARAFLKRATNEILVPYDTPLHIPISIKTSRLSWGDCK